MSRPSLSRKQAFVATLNESFSRDLQVYKIPADSPLPTVDEDGGEYDMDDRFEMLVSMSEEIGKYWIDTDRPVYLGIFFAEDEEEALELAAQGTGYRAEQIELHNVSEHEQYYG